MPIVRAAIEIEMIATVDLFMLALLFLMLLMDKNSPEFGGRGIYHSIRSLSRIFFSFFDIFLIKICYSENMRL